MPITLEAQRRADASPFVDLDRADWSALHDRTPLPLSAEEVEGLRGLGDVIDLQEVQDVYLPLSRLLNLYVTATSRLRGTLNDFLDDNEHTHTQAGTPFVIGVAGSVAVGKSTTARVLQAMLARWPEHPQHRPGPGHQVHPGQCLGLHECLHQAFGLNRMVHLGLPGSSPPSVESDSPPTH